MSESNQEQKLPKILLREPKGHLYEISGKSNKFISNV